jgi:hypothetical protein
MPEFRESREERYSIYSEVVTVAPAVEARASPKRGAREGMAEGLGGVVL